MRLSATDCVAGVCGYGEGMRRATISSEARRVLEEVAGHYKMIRGFAARGVHVADASQAGGALVGQKVTSPLEFLYRAPNLFRLTHGDQEVEGWNRPKTKVPMLLEYGCRGDLIYSHRRGGGHSSFAVDGKLRIDAGGRVRQELYGLMGNLPVLFVMADDPVGVILSHARAVSAQSASRSGETRIVVEGQLPTLARAELVLDGVLGLVWFEYRMSGGGASMVLRDEFASFEVAEVGVERFKWNGIEGM